MNTLNQYQKVTHQSVDKLFNDIEQLKQEGKYIKEEKKTMFNLKVTDLEEKKEALRLQFNQLSSVSGQATEDLKKGIEQAKGSLTSALKETKEEFVS